MKVTRIGAAALVAVLTTALALSATPQPAAAAGSGPALVTPDGTVLRPTFTPKPGFDNGTRTGGATVNGMCSLNGTTPVAQPTAMLEGQVYFSGQVQCDVAGSIEITVADLQLDISGAWRSRKMSSPWTRPSPGIVGQGVTTDPDACVSISLGAWRGAIHPRLFTSFGTYDWGWYANAPVNLSC